MSVKKQIGIRIKELRKMRGYSQEELATLADITAKHLSNIENYGHELQRKELQSKINSIVKTSKDDDLRLIMKFINTIKN
jgi:transcriptional regulator with XRE-family HTH domain